MEKVQKKVDFSGLVPHAITILIVAIMLVFTQATAKTEQATQAFNAGVLSYQGTLMDTEENPVTGSIEITFRIYNSLTSTTPLWDEVRSGGNAVPVQNGLFNVMLGSLNPIPGSIWEEAELFLGIKIGSDDEMQPRVKLTAVPSAVMADVAQLALTVPDGSITIEKLGEQPYFFYGSFATPTEWMADVIFNGNYPRFCQAIGRTFSHAETLTAHYTEYPSAPRGKGNGYFYKDWYYVGQRINDVDIHVYGNGDPADHYNVWKVNEPDYPYTVMTWTYERSAIIWCKP